MLVIRKLVARIIPQTKEWLRCTFYLHYQRINKHNNLVLISRKNQVRQKRKDRIVIHLVIKVIARLIGLRSIRRSRPHLVKRRRSTLFWWTPWRRSQRYRRTFNNSNSSLKGLFSRQSPLALAKLATRIASCLIQLHKWTTSSRERSRFRRRAAQAILASQASIIIVKRQQWSDLQIINNNWISTYSTLSAEVSRPGVRPWIHAQGSSEV